MAALFVMLPAPAARAQYMYLDTNGDGVHTAADVITATGTTSADIYLRTDKRRDGSTVVCASGEPLSCNSYEVILRAVGGTVAFSNATNLQSAMGTQFGSLGSSTEYYIGYGGGTIFPPGDFLLARIGITVASGAPEIQVAPSAPTLGTFPRETAFGSPCEGNDFDNTLKLGSDWFDADGLAFSSGSTSNPPPVLAPLGPMASAIGEIAAQDVSATDSDGDLIDITVSGGPSFLTLTPLTKVLGAATSRLHLRPLRGDAGGYQANVAASDPVGSQSATIAITVTDGADHAPSIAQSSAIDVLATTVRRVPIRVNDSDGDRIALQLVDGPPFATIEQGANGSTARSGALRLSPTLCDIGDWAMTLRATANGLMTDATVQAHVRAPIAPAAPLVRRFVSSAGYAIDGIVGGDFNRDGHADVAVHLAGSGSASYIAIWLGDGRGGLSQQPLIPVAFSATELGAGDWTGDGVVDLVTSGLGSTNTWFLKGRGDGSFDPPVPIPGAATSVDFRSADFDGDGVDELIAASESEAAYVIRGDGSGGVRVSQRLQMGSASKNVAVGDFNLDGMLDVAFTSFGSPHVDVFFGRGDGTFGGRKSSPLPSAAIPLREGDFDRDGRLDLVTSLLDDGSIYFLRGDGTGGFAPVRVGIASSLSFDIAALDWDADGNDDLAIGGEEGPGVVYPGRGDGSLGAPIATGLPISGEQMTVADFNEDGRPDFAVSAGAVVIALNGTQTITGVAARAFTTAAEKIIALNSSSSSVCLRIEPVDATFQVTDINLSSVKLTSSGTGTTNSIDASGKKTTVVADTDKNGILDVGVCFATSDMSRLLANLRGRQDVTVHLEGSLVDGRRFCAPVTLNVIGTGALAGAARVEPNPLNPAGVLRFTTTSAGAVSVRLFDVSGRLVRSLWNARATTLGDQEIRIDGKDAGGRSLRSGIYFYRIDGAGVNETGRFTILK